MPLFLKQIWPLARLSLLSLLLTACVHQIPLHLDTESRILNQTRLLHKSTWKLSGKIGVKSTHEGGNFSFHWQQTGADYTLEISGPLSQGTAILTQTNGLVKLTNSKGETSESTNAAALLYSETHLYLPITFLPYWIKAVPAPIPVLNATYDKDGLLTELKQAEWTIHYGNYVSSDDLILPTNIQIRRNDLSIKIILQNWS